MPKILVAGDTHGNFHHLEKVMKAARKEEANAVVQVGDWGFSWPSAMPKVFESFCAIIERYGVPFFFLEGNHDNYDWLKLIGAWSADAPVEIAPHVTYLPRGATWKWGSLKFMACGGGVSIDKDQRIPGLSWWSEEMVTDDDLRKVFAAGKVDVLLTHDAPNNSGLERFLVEHSVFVQRQGYDGYKIDDISKANRQQLDLVYQSAQPKVAIHGHYHHFYVHENYDTGQRIVGLDRDTKGRESWLLLDTETLT